MKKTIFLLLAMFFTISANSQTNAKTSGLPTQSGNAGKYLKTNGSKLSWANVTAGLSASLTPNYIPYAVSSTSLANSSIFINTITGYIGIGESYFLPSYRFQVNEPVYFHKSVKSCIDPSSNFGIGTSSPTSKLQVVGLVEYADNAAAITAGLTIGAFYRTGDLLKVVH